MDNELKQEYINVRKNLINNFLKYDNELSNKINNTLNKNETFRKEIDNIELYNDYFLDNAYKEEIDNINDNEVYKINTGFYYCLGILMIKSLECFLYSNYLIINGQYITREDIEINDNIIKIIFSYLHDGEKAFKYASRYNEITKLNLDIDNQLRILYQKISLFSSCYLSKLLDEFLYYSTKAIEYGSITSLCVLLNYYSDNDEDNDFSKANYYLNLLIKKIQSYKIDDNINKFNSIFKTSITSINHYKKVLEDRGLYKDAKKVSDSLSFIFNYFKKINIKNNLIDIKLYDSLIKINEDDRIKYNKIIKETNGKRLNTKIYENYFSEESLLLMPLEIKKYISTSLLVFDFINNSNEYMDYSSMTIPLMKAVERLLFIIFKYSYLPFLSNYLKDKNIETKYLGDSLYKGKENKKIELKNSEDINQLELGCILKSISITSSYFKNNKYYKEYLPSNTYFNEYINSNNNFINGNEIVNRLIKELPLITNTRNLSAHMNEVVEIEAIKVKNDIIGKLRFIDFILINFSFVFKEYNKLNK